MQRLNSGAGPVETHGAAILWQFLMLHDYNVEKNHVFFFNSWYNKTSFDYTTY